MTNQRRKIHNKVRMCIWVDTTPYIIIVKLAIILGKHIEHMKHGTPPPTPKSIIIAILWSKEVEPSKYMWCILPHSLSFSTIRPPSISWKFNRVLFYRFMPTTLTSFTHWTYKHRVNDSILYYKRCLVMWVV